MSSSSSSGSKSSGLVTKTVQQAGVMQVPKWALAQAAAAKRPAASKPAKPRAPAKEEKAKQQGKPKSSKSSRSGDVPAPLIEIVKEDPQQLAAQKTKPPPKPAAAPKAQLGSKSKQSEAPKPATAAPAAMPGVFVPQYNQGGGEMTLPEAKKPPKPKPEVKKIVVQPKKTAAEEKGIRERKPIVPQYNKAEGVMTIPLSHWHEPAAAKTTTAKPTSKPVAKQAAKPPQTTQEKKPKTASDKPLRVEGKSKKSSSEAVKKKSSEERPTAQILTRGEATPTRTIASKAGTSGAIVRAPQYGEAAGEMTLPEKAAIKKRPPPAAATRAPAAAKRPAAAPLASHSKPPAPAAKKPHRVVSSSSSSDEEAEEMKRRRLAKAREAREREAREREAREREARERARKAELARRRRYEEEEDEDDDLDGFIVDDDEDVCGSDEDRSLQEEYRRNVSREINKVAWGNKHRLERHRIAEQQGRMYDREDGGHMREVHSRAELEAEEQGTKKRAAVLERLADLQERGIDVSKKLKQLAELKKRQAAAPADHKARSRTG